MTLDGMIGPAEARQTARAALRRSTADAHLRMHGLSPFVEIAGQRLTRTRYLKLLRALFMFHSSIAVAARRAGWSSICSSAAKIDRIATDVWNLRAYAPDCQIGLEPGSPFAVLGAIYVAEGSMIGNRIVARQLDYLLGPDAEGREFLAGRGPRDEAAWRDLLAVLELRLDQRQALNEAIAGAHSAFDLFEACIGHCGLSVGYEKPPLPGEAGALHGSGRMAGNALVTAAG